MNIMKIKINYIFTILYIGLISNIYAQNNPELNGQKDWEYLNQMKNFFCKAPEECNEVDNMNLLEYLIYVDKLYASRSKLAEDFLDKYPDNPHYDEALQLFLSSYFAPRFIPDKIDKEKAEIISKLPRKGDTNAWAKAYRLLPVDEKAKKRWLNKGKGYVNKILNSNAPDERKVKIAILLFNRDYILASNNYAYLIKDSNEQDYWDSFEKFYWESMQLRLEELRDTYPDSVTLAKFIQAILDDIRGFSPKLAKDYTDRFIFELEKNNLLSNRKGTEALHLGLANNLKAIEAWETNSTNKPIEMAFTAFDGKYVDLSKMKGKVILIDFWSTRCPPCIAAMPQLKAIYDKYKEKGFEIIGVAADGDKSRDNIKKILNKANADWPQYLDGGKDATVSYHSLYQIKVLPTMWLLDTEGKIVENKIELSQLESLIHKYLEL